MIDENQVWDMQSQVLITRSFPLFEQVYLKTGLRVQRVSQRLENVIIFPEFLAPNCGYCGPDRAQQQIASRFTHYVLGIPLMIGTTYQMGTTRIYGETGLSANAQFYAIRHLENVNPRTSQSVRNAGIVDRLVVRPAAYVGGGIERRLSSEASHNVGIYADWVVHDEGALVYLDFWTPSVTSVELGIQVGIRLSK